MEFDQFVSMWWFEKEFKEEKKKKEGKSVKKNIIKIVLNKF